MLAPDSQRRFHLLDVVALVVGYGMAALLIRAFWPSAGRESLAVLLVGGVVYLWLGLAMSGPVVLYQHRREPGDPASARRVHSWAELAWLVIGFYWLGLTALVVPMRMRNARLLDAGVFGLFPILAALAIRAFRPRKPRDDSASPKPEWTHYTAIGLLATWPVAWAALIILGKTLP